MFWVVKILRASTRTTTTTTANYRGVHSLRSIVKKFKYLMELDNTLLRAPTKEELAKSKLVPDGYEIVYINKHIKYIDCIHVSVFMGIGFLINNLSGYFRDPNWMNKDLGRLGTLNPWFAICLSCYTVLMWILASRTVRVVFQKGDDFKLLFYGRFGKFSKIYVDQTRHAIRAPKSAMDPFHYCNNGKRIILLPEHFRDPWDYWKLIKDTEM